MRSDPVQALIDTQDVPLCALDADLRYTAFNTSHATAMRALYGAEVALGGRLLDHLTVPADHERARVNLERALAGAQVVDEAACGEPGRERRFEVVHTPITDAAGEVVGVALRATDVTEIPRARQALAGGEALYRSIIDASPDALGLADLRGDLRFISSAGRDMLGYEGDEAPVGRSIMQFIVPEDRERAAADMARIVRGAPWGPVEYRALRADGGIVPVEVRASLTSDAEGRPAGVVFAVRDISDRRRILEALDLSENKFRIAFHTSPDSVCLNRLSDGAYLDISDGFTESTGYTRDDVEGKTSIELQIWDDPEDRRRLARTLETDGVAHGMEMSFRRKDGTRGTGLMSARLIDVGGEPCILSITRDISERKEMEATLKDSEDRFRYVFEYSPIGKSITSLDGEIHVNRAFCRMLGYEQDELEHMHWQDIGPAEDAPAVQATLGPLLAGERDEVRLERRYLHKDGSIVWADVAIVLRRDEDGTPRYFVVSITDINDRKRIEDSLRAALEESRRLEAERRLLSDTIEASLNEIYIFSAATLRFLFVNEGARRNLGYTEQECLQMTPVDIKPEFTSESFAATIEPLVEGRQPRLVFRTVHERADGSRYPVEVHLQLFDQRPEPVFLAVIQDITEREKVEAALMASEEKWRRILVDTPQVGVSLDREGRIIFVNRHFLDLTGWCEDEVLGQDWFDLCIPPGVRREVRGVFDTLMRQQSMEGLHEYDNDILTKDGGLVSVAWSNVASHDVHGAVVEVTSLGIDITERRRAEDEVRRLNAELERRVVERTAQFEAANRELEAFAYSISHDLRAPLRAIDGFSAMVLEDAGDKLREEDLEHLARVRASAQRMGRLIDEILALSRVTRQEMHVEEVDITRSAEEVLAELAEAEPARRVETVVARGLRARADATLLRVILVNLLSNAWKFTSKHETARIEVGATDCDGEPAFYVRDDGAGFNTAHATRLFGAFQRMHGVGEFEGEGIGLATVQRLVARHGGRVWAEAEVEKGATFFFTLPWSDLAD